MKNAKFAVLLLLVALFSPIASAIAQDTFAGLFAAPPSWKQVPSPERSMYVFQTNPEKENTLYVTVRFINVPNQTAMQWAQDEVKALVEKQGAKPLSGPAETTVGKNAFVHISSQLTPAGKNFISDQYFGQPIAGLVVEVAAVGPPTVLESEKQNLDSLLSSFSF